MRLQPFAWRPAGSMAPRWTAWRPCSAFGRRSASKEAAQEIATVFHVKPAELAGNGFFSRGLADAMTRLSRARWLDTQVGHHGWGEHRAILAALRSGDTDKAVQLLEAHIQESRDRLVQVFQDSRRSIRARGARITGWGPSP